MLDTERVRMGRLKLRLSQKRLGAMIGQDQAYVSRLERGHFPEISMTTLERPGRCFTGQYGFSGWAYGQRNRTTAHRASPSWPRVLTRWVLTRTSQRAGV